MLERLEDTRAQALQGCDRGLVAHPGCQAALVEQIRAGDQQQVGGQFRLALLYQRQERLPI
jgi:hypothetical protein